MFGMQRNIGLFNDSFPPVMDGVGICVRNYAYWMQKRVGGVSVITPANQGADYSDTEYEVLTYASIPVPMSSPYVTGVAEIDPFYLTKILKRSFKIVHAHCPFTSGLAASRVAKLQRIPFVATFHTKYRDNFERVLKNKFIVDKAVDYVVNFYQGADQVWVPQESVKEVLYSYGFKGNIEVVQNGCDLGSDYPEIFFEESRKALGISQDEFVLLYVGQHIWEKNLRFTIEALSRIQDLPYRMFFVGRGYAQEQMKELVSELGIENKVTFTGPVMDREQLKRYYAAADLFLFPSLYDTDGIVVREAAAFNTPSVMLSEATASSMLVNGETGFLIDNNLDSFETMLRKLIKSPQELKVVGKRASKTIVRSWEDIAAEVIDRYNSLIAKKALITKI